MRLTNRDNFYFLFFEFFCRYSDITIAMKFKGNQDIRIEKKIYQQEIKKTRLSLKSIFYHKNVNKARDPESS